MAIVKNEAFVFNMSLSKSNAYIIDPTIEAGDFQISIDDGAFVNLATLPVVIPTGSPVVRVNLSADEMNGDRINIFVKDVAGDEWVEALLHIDTGDGTAVDELAQIMKIKKGEPVVITTFSPDKHKVEVGDIILDVIRAGATETVTRVD